MTRRRIAQRPRLRSFEMFCFLFLTCSQHTRARAASGYFVGLKRNGDSFMWLDGTIESRSSVKWEQKQSAEEGSCVIMTKKNYKFQTEACKNRTQYICSRTVGKTWSEWISRGCSTSCNSGIETRFRQCRTFNSSGAEYCDGTRLDYQKLPCNTHLCNEKHRFLGIGGCNATCFESGVERRYHQCKSNKTFPVACAAPKHHPCSINCSTVGVAAKVITVNATPLAGKRVYLLVGNTIGACSLIIIVVVLAMKKIYETRIKTVLRSGMESPVGYINQSCAQENHEQCTGITDLEGGTREISMDKDVVGHCNGRISQIIPGNNEEANLNDTTNSGQQLKQDTSFMTDNVLNERDVLPRQGQNGYVVTDSVTSSVASGERRGRSTSSTSTPLMEVTK